MQALLVNKFGQEGYVSLTQTLAVEVLADMDSLLNIWRRSHACPIQVTWPVKKKHGHDVKAGYICIIAPS